MLLVGGLWIVRSFRGFEMPDNWEWPRCTPSWGRHTLASSTVSVRVPQTQGTGHLAREMVSALKLRQGAELGLEARDVRNVTLAGLLHDLGHGTNSHGFEQHVVRVLEYTPC